ncbi:putative mitochondrial F1F0 ATP synthase subunit F [Protomyces lactucae-debilis]|uniref:Putative mitochondrial F1F0 ATP synthase subunit F n=1 Tax=Protomyces lactucae-debilis TaxID=2754530 RepID=A0A1Y2FD66_PROLT|nr:putative mitochondrial F1F0 ATP synthase subunit F [Protomyces lactucae-debilis]ORY81547.1 putative mitochondrial F1F0 ATP synthase subunit F [Protomyces lactucae-debilis]
MLKALVPPKIANPKSIGVAADAARMTRVVSFYKALPRGAAAKQTGWKARNIDGKNPSGMPMIYLIGGLFVIGYSLDYAFHLSHHKNHEHH